MTDISRRAFLRGTASALALAAVAPLGALGSGLRPDADGNYWAVIHPDVGQFLRDFLDEAWASEANPYRGELASTVGMRFIVEHGDD